MIRLALGLELRGLLRSPLRLLFLAVVFGVGWIVIGQGQADVERWQAAIQDGETAQSESIEEARSWFSEGVTGPADRPWINLSQAHYQDYFAATRISRLPAPLAGIAFASAEHGAVTMRLNRFADPMVAHGSEIENPALDAAGGLDLVTVLSLLIPLLVLALGVELGGYERSSGLLSLVRVQSGRDSAWVWARCLAVGLMVSIVALALCGIAVSKAGATLGDGAPLFALVVLYIGVWTALLALVASISRDPSHGAVLLGGAWILLCVIIPSLGVEQSAALAADDFALDLTVEAREERGAAYDLSESDLYAAVYERFPDLRAVEPNPRSAGVRHARDGVRFAGLEERMRGRHDLARSQGDLVSMMECASPALALTHALEGLAGRGPAAAQAFREAAVTAIGDRTERVIRADWGPDSLGADHFESLIDASPGAVALPPFSVQRELLIMGGWLLGLLALASLAASRAQRA